MLLPLLVVVVLVVFWVAVVTFVWEVDVFVASEEDNIDLLLAVAVAVAVAAALRLSLRLSSTLAANSFFNLATLFVMSAFFCSSVLSFFFGCVCCVCFFCNVDDKGEILTLSSGPLADML